jgi:hypothetical protein
VNTYNRDAVQMDPSKLKIDPPTMLYPTSGHLLLLTDPTPTHNPPKTVRTGSRTRNNSGSRNDSTVSSMGNPVGGIRPAAETTKKESSEHIRIESAHFYGMPLPLHRVTVALDTSYKK